ncbi:MAG TPA: type I-E CRISPR-associated protein Cse1/CasA [Geobacteraceae bacterium]
MNGFSYNLIDEPWIGCTGRDGSLRTVGLRELLLSAHELREIESHNPLTIAALLRVLLALVHRAVAGPKTASEWKSLYSDRRFPETSIAPYLQKVHDRFDLFSELCPFYQCAGLTNLDANKNPMPVSVAVMMLERASGNNKTIFDHTTDDTPLALSPAEAARALITTQMFALGGLNKKTTNWFDYQQSYLNASLVSGIFIALAGESLFETLMLNLLLPEYHQIPINDGDRPIWERDERGSDKARTPSGYLDFLTCQCRHIRLVPERQGDKVTVSRLHIAQGEVFPDVANPAFMRKKNNKTDEYYNPQLDSDRLVWRDSFSLFAFDQGVDERPAAFRQATTMKKEVLHASRYLCTAIALANDKANPLAWRKENLPVPVTLLEEKETVNVLSLGMEQADGVSRILDGAVKLYIRNVLPPNSKDVNDKANATGALRFYWDRLEGHFQTFLAGIDTGDGALLTWYGDIAATARDALESCVRQRYADSAASFKAWAAAVDELNKKLVGLNSAKGGK